MSVEGLRVPTQEEVAMLSVQERAEFAAALLEGLEPGRQPLDLFTQFARLTVMSTVELIAFDSNPPGNTQVLLTQRPSDDPWWPNMWHVPGTALLPTDIVTRDETIDFTDECFNPFEKYEKGPIDRILKNELQDCVVVIDGPHLLQARPRLGIRGPENTVFFYAQVDQVEDKLAVGEFFDVEAVLSTPPEGGLIVGHQYIIEQAFEDAQDILK